MARTALKSNAQYRTTGRVYANEEEAALKWLWRHIKQDALRAIRRHWMYKALGCPTGKRILKLALQCLAAFAAGYVLVCAVILALS